MVNQFLVLALRYGGLAISCWPHPILTRRAAQMNEGDMHSGPYGYSPNTAYSETQYGSMFDEEADWNEEER